MKTKLQYELEQAINYSDNEWRFYQDSKSDKELVILNMVREGEDKAMAEFKPFLDE